ncbi:hypothetical protein BDN67DRAFT_509816 [Paxillus ammoniavirescens]|nr:hypothetical protein BDN67DRAFT_509816 [Paxillus ammoniavirescens]
MTDSGMRSYLLSTVVGCPHCTDSPSYLIFQQPPRTRKTMNHRRNGGLIVAFVFASSVGNHLDTCLGDKHTVQVQHDIDG